MSKITNIIINNNTSSSWKEIKQNNTYKCKKTEQLKLLHKHQTKALHFEARIGMFNASMGIGTDSWFQNIDETASFLLEWGVPGVGKPWFRVKKQNDVSVECKFEQNNLLVNLDEPKKLDFDQNMPQESNSTKTEESPIYIDDENEIIDAEITKAPKILIRYNSNPDFIRKYDDLMTSSTASNSESEVKSETNQATSKVSCHTYEQKLTDKISQPEIVYLVRNFREYIGKKYNPGVFWAK